MLVTSMTYFKVKFYKKQLNINYKKIETMKNRNYRQAFYFSLRWERPLKHKNSGTKRKEK